MIPRRTWTNVLATSVRWWYQVRIIMWWCSVSRAVGSYIQVNDWLMRTGDRPCPWECMLDSCGYIWHGCKSLTVQASGAASVVMVVVWRTMICYWFVIVKVVVEPIT